MTDLSEKMANILMFIIIVINIAVWITAGYLLLINT